MLNGLAAGGLLSVMILTGIAWGFARVFDAGRRVERAVLALGLAVLPLSQLLPAGNVFRERIADSLAAFGVVMAILAPLIGYLYLLRRIRRRSGGDAARPAPVRTGLGLIEPDDTLNAEMHQRLLDLNGTEGGMTPERFSLVWRGEDGRIVASLRVVLALGRAEMKTFWVDEAERGKGTGAMLLRAAEEEARTRGARLAVLDTFSWQAPGFYEKQGYERSFERTFPDGGSQIFMEKPL
ncbi:MAG: GNAT family N-acetyltransferase [Rubricella sp.]